MKNSTRIKIGDILSSTAVIGVIALLLIVVSWSGGVLNDIKEFDVVKNSKTKLSYDKIDLNASKAFEFSKNKISSGYKFTLGKLVTAKNSIAVMFKDNNSTSDSNVSIIVSNNAIDLNTSSFVDRNRTHISNTDLNKSYDVNKSISFVPPADVYTKNSNNNKKGSI